MSGQWSKVPTSAPPSPVACEECSEAVDAVWCGTGWLVKTMCEACATAAMQRQVAREHLDRWKPQLLEQVGPLHFEQRPVALIEALGVFAQTGATAHHSAAYLYGPPGTGKTQQLVWLAQRVLKVWAQRDRAPAICPVLYVRVPSLLHALRGDVQQLATYQRAPWLMLDEIGAEELTPWGMAQLNEIIEHRLRWRLPTAYAGNVSLRELLEGAVVGWDERMVARMVQMVGQDDDGTPRCHHKLTHQLRLKGGR